MAIELIQGEDGYRLLTDPAFQASYTELYDACPWSTAFQHLDFVGTWYREYRDVYQPVIVCRFEDAHLSGVLTLARSRNGALTVAGANQAEYQCWLARTDAAVDFLRETALALRRAFPGRALQFRYLPADLPAALLMEDRLLRNRCQLAPVTRPLFATAAAAKSLRGRMKTKLNGLQRLGQFRFEHIDEEKTFRTVFDQIVLQHNLRQGIKGLPGFLADPHKAPFHLALFAHRHLLHVTTLKVGDELIASHIGFRSRAQLHLGILTTSVFQRYARYSPGRMQLLLLAEQLEREQVPALDLTPYGEYKEKMATHWDTSHLLVLQPSRARLSYAASKSAGVTLVKRALATVGLTPATVRAQFADARSALMDLRQRLRPHGKEWILVGAATSAFAASRLEPGGADSLAHLLLYQGPDRQRFLAQAIERIEAGLQVHSWVEHGRLAYCAWVSRGQEKASLPDDYPRLPPGAALVFDLHRASSDADACSRYLAGLCALLAADPANEHIYILAQADRSLLATLRSLGFSSEYRPPPVASSRRAPRATSARSP